MEKLNTLLKRLDGFKVIEATEDKIKLETQLGVLEVAYRVDVIYNHSSKAKLFKEFPIQVCLTISKNGKVLHSWGSMNNEQNVQIIHFFQEKYDEEVQKEYFQRGQDEEKVGTLLNL